MTRRLGSKTVVAVVLVAAVGAVAATSAGAEILPVPAAIRHWQGAKDEQHVLRSPAGTMLGTQHVHAVVAEQQLRFDIVTRFTTGDEWDEEGELDLTDGTFRAQRFTKTMRVAGKIAQEQYVDFTTGAVRWKVDGVEAERVMTLPADTYIGPMLGMVLGGPATRSTAATTFTALVFRPDPVVVTLRAEAAATAAPTGEPATRFRVKADLGPVKNVLFASLIPTHQFWFSHAPEPALLAFEGKLGNGLEIVMTPETPATTTAGVHRAR